MERQRSVLPPAPSWRERTPAEHARGIERASMPYAVGGADYVRRTLADLVGADDERLRALAQIEGDAKT